jgi:hypothetical protein
MWSCSVVPVDVDNGFMERAMTEHVLGEGGVLPAAPMDTSSAEGSAAAAVPLSELKSSGQTLLNRPQ